MEKDKIEKDVTQSTPDLDVIIKEGLKQFEIPPEEQKPPAEPGSNTEDGPAAAVTKEKKDEKDAATAAAAAAAAAVAKTNRFKSHDEAETGYKNLHSEFSRVVTQNKEMDDKIKALEETEKGKAALDVANQEFETIATERRTKLLNEIDALDPDDKDYRINVAKLQASADKDILTAGQKIVAAVKPAAAAPAPSIGTDQTDKTKPTPEQITTYVSEQIVKPEKEGGPGLAKDDVLFWTYASKAPVKNETGKDMTLDEQIQWAVEQTKLYHSQINPVDKQKEIEDAAKIAAANQKIEMPLGRAGAGAPENTTEDDNKSISLSEAIDQANNLRRL